MATRPTLYPEWAEVDQNDSTTGAPNKVEPTDSFKQTGLNRNEALLRAYLNYNFDLIDSWVKYLNEKQLSGNENFTGGVAVVTIPDQGTTDYVVVATPKGDVGNFWITNDSSTQFTINTSSNSSDSVDWVLINNQ